MGKGKGIIKQREDLRQWVSVQDMKTTPSIPTSLNSNICSTGCSGSLLLFATASVAVRGHFHNLVVCMRGSSNGSIGARDAVHGAYEIDEQT